MIQPAIPLNNATLAWLKQQLGCIRPIEIVQSIRGDVTGDIFVVGDPTMAHYEYVIVKCNVVTCHSNAGYGYPEAALRDALIEAIGLADAPPPPVCVSRPGAQARAQV